MIESAADRYRVIEDAVAQFGTPCYLLFWNDVQSALQQLATLDGDLPVRHWLSMKTQPVARLLREWRSTGRGVEVVSEFELRAALYEGFACDNILVNGVAKHAWLRGFPIEGLRVHFDSIREVSELATFAKTFRWRVGIRCAVPSQFDPDEPSYSTQFGLSASEAALAIDRLRDTGVNLESVHFHLRSNIRDPHDYESAIRATAAICAASAYTPFYLDCGGGLPCPGDDVNASDETAFSLAALATVLHRAHMHFPALKEVWFENGRFVTGRSGVLVLRVIDVKERPEGRYIICDGGRTNHALVSDWETHKITIFPPRSTNLIPTTVCGPTCMAFDRLARVSLPEDVSPGDLVLWANAGAYHIPWETRFSNGLIPVVWVDEKANLTLAREKENFEHWWEIWK